MLLILIYSNLVTFPLSVNFNLATSRWLAGRIIYNTEFNISLIVLDAARENCDAFCWG